MAFLLKSLFLLMIFECRKVKSQKSQSALVGSTIQIKCPYDGRNNNFISWYTQSKQLSFEEKIYNAIPGLTPRLNITGNRTAGEYHLSISDMRKTDEGPYVCLETKTVSTYVQHLVVIESPTSVIISNKVSGKVQGIEDQDLTINCTAEGGDPAPDMTLQIGTDAFNGTRKHTILHTIQRVSRSYDGVSVTCQAGYDGITYTPLTDTAGITLLLKPLIPTFSMNPVVTQNTKPLVISCTSTGSRPAPTERMWFIDNVNIASSSTLSLPTQQSDGTFSVTSTLTFKFSKEYNGKYITCGFKNIATGNVHVIVRDRIDVQYAPVVSVQNNKFTLTQTSREIRCMVDSNPNSTYSRWQHKSKYGTLIRELDGAGTLVLPQQIEEGRYQDTGEYICTVSNGIRDEYENLDQRGLGYVISTAPPRFLDGSSQVKLGQFSKDVNIEVSVYSIPKYSTPTWLKSGSVLPKSGKYTTEEVSDIIADTFYNVKVQVDGYRLTLSIQNLVESDFVNYTLRLNNGEGQTVEHVIILISASPPETPTNFSVSDETESTVNLHWIPAFDGGHDQWFCVQYRIVGTQPWQEAKISDPIQFTVYELQSFTLPGLQGGTSYEIRVYAENKYNKSLPTDTEKISTKDIGSKEGTSIAIAVGVSIVVGIAIIIGGFFIYRIILRRQKQSSATHLSGNDNNFADYYNINSQVSDTSSQRENHYEKMTPRGSECDNVYTDLDSQNGDNNRKSGAYNNYINIDQEKTNVYEEIDKRKVKGADGQLYVNTVI